MANTKISGTIKQLFQTQVVSEKFSKREIVVTESGQYPQDILIQFSNDKCGILDNYKVGQQVEVDANVRVREWINPQGEAKYFNTIEGWKINLASGASPIPQAIQKDVPVEQLAPIQDGEDDLHF